MQRRLAFRRLSGRLKQPVLRPASLTDLIRGGIRDSEARVLPSPREQPAERPGTAFSEGNARK
jgi:hypothetical protein